MSKHCKKAHDNFKIDMDEEKLVGNFLNYAGIDSDASAFCHDWKESFIYYARNDYTESKIKSNWKNRLSRVSNNPNIRDFYITVIHTETIKNVQRRKIPLMEKWFVIALLETYAES